MPAFVGLLNIDRNISAIGKKDKLVLFCFIFI